MSKIFLKIKREFIAILSKFYVEYINTNYDGLKLKVPLIHGMKNGGYIVPAEEWMTDYLKLMTEQKKGMVLDIGANVGICLVKLRSFSDSIKYCGIEANASASFYMQELIRLNEFKNCELYTIALSDKLSTESFYISKAADKTGSLVLEHQEAYKKKLYTLNVVTMKADDLLQTIDLSEGISVIKIDVESAELYVLQGMIDTIKTFQPFIICEILDSTSSDDSKKHTQFISELLYSIGYSIIGLNFKTKNFEVIAEHQIGTSEFNQNYIFSPNKEMYKLIDQYNNNLNQ